MVRLNRLKVRRPKGTDGRHNVNGGFGDGGRGGGATYHQTHHHKPLRKPLLRAEMTRILAVNIQ